MESRLKHFPAPLFAVVMGLSGLAIAYQKAAVFFGYPKIIGTSLVYLTVAVFAVFALTYLAKLVKYPDEVKKEFSHPVRINFFPAISICLLLLSIALHKMSPAASKILWYIGAPLHLFFTLYVIRYWIVKNLEINHSNPAWFIPIVGNVLVPITGVGYAGVDVAQFYFSIGIFFWVVLFTIILYRIVFHHQLPAKFLPTLFIFIAPAAVGFISYVKIAEGIAHITSGVVHTQYIIFDFFAHFLYDVGMFFTLLVFFMFRLFVKVPYAITWWAYTFPMAAMTIASILNYHLNKVALQKGIMKVDYIFGMEKDMVFYYTANILLWFTTVLIVYVTYKTIQAALKREICIPE
jgi:tellurite resistance protein